MKKAVEVRRVPCQVDGLSTMGSVSTNLQERRVVRTYQFSKDRLLRAGLCCVCHSWIELIHIHPIPISEEHKLTKGAVITLVASSRRDCNVHAHA